MVDPEGGVREVAGEVLYIGLVHIPSVCRLAGEGRSVRQVFRRDKI